MTQPEVLEANAVLRGLVKHSAEREVAIIIGPLREKIQILESDKYHLTRDLGALKERLETLEAIVRGDTTIGLVGLVSTVQTLVNSVSALVGRLDKKDTDERIEKQRLADFMRAGKWVATALLALGVLDNSFVQGLVSAIVKGLP